MKKLIEYLNAVRGRRQLLANAIGINPAAISQWKEVPSARVGEVSRATGIPMDELRPDIFGAVTTEAAE